jgi:hypothetical protein
MVEAKRIWFVSKYQELFLESRTQFSNKCIFWAQYILVWTKNRWKLEMNSKTLVNINGGGGMGNHSRENQRRDK